MSRSLVTSDLRAAIATLATLAIVLLPPVGTERSRAATPPGPYALTDLGTLGGSSAQAYHINDAGQVVGYATTTFSQVRAFRWQNGTMTDLGTLGGNRSEANAINEDGQAAGTAVTSNSAQEPTPRAGATVRSLT